VEGYKPYKLFRNSKTSFYPTVTSLIRFIHSLMIGFLFLKEEPAAILKTQKNKPEMG